MSKLFRHRRQTPAPSNRIVYELPDPKVFKKYYNQDTFFHDVDWFDWSATIDGFKARFEKWYFEEMTGGHSSYLDFCALCALIEVFCHYEFEKDWHEPKNYKEFLRKLDPVFRKKLGSPIPVTRYEGGRWTSGRLIDYADVFYVGVRCSLHHHGDLASFAGMMGTGILATEKPAAVKRLGDTSQYPMVIFDPGKLKTSLEEWLGDYCDELRNAPKGAKSDLFRKKFEIDFGIAIPQSKQST